MADLSDQQLVHKVIRDVAGDSGMLAVQEARGGMHIWIPLDPGSEHWLSQAVGHDHAREISRRLTIINAEGRRSCNMEAYIPRRQTRLQELRAKIREEILDCLSRGMSIRSTALQVRVTEKDVQTERKSLLSIGTQLPDLRPGRSSITILAARPQRIALPAPTSPPQDRPSDPNLWEMRVAIVDEGLVKGYSTRRVSIEAEVSRTFVRVRRKILLASGKIRPGRIGSYGSNCKDCTLPSSPLDHPANIGEMVPPAPEVS